ncbi:E4 SUMO-protein ligase PIAL2-like isoform X1 [Papaver somniferum]|uniref:E4 SUMO-protein ligase PIAL2-like isoform X1 n=1 Tax=Papaver somniferum TaxID=3469 RepID=UPI000E6FEDF8|nr:E4 SUMO-protein ligase PIAL2-like isoform X1 [Papaver somniferum]
MGGGSTHSGGGGGNKTNPESSSMDSSKVTSVAKQLSKLISTGHRFDSRQFNLCVSLARGIDYAIVNNEIPDGVDELPSLFKQVYEHNKNGVLLEATSMMLMASLKSACRSGWFLAKDAEELLNFANEVSVSFCNPPDIVIEPSNPPPVISNIINRFYPWIKMTRIFASLEVKPGYGAYLLDFHVLKNEATIHEKFRLFVAQTDNVDTSSCLITPQQANFLLNGKGIRRRIINSLDNRPQIPTNVTAMVEYGTNLLQAVGDFNGNYTIIVAFTSEASIDTPDLQHYARPLSAVNSLDSGIVKGVSRISLNCPISSRRISVPAKGRLCEHQQQCFDYANYIKINSRRPSWRCPQCSQSVCYTDIYIDQRTVEVLEGVGENVLDVIISADGSWKPVRETDDPAHKQDKTLGKEGDEPNHCIPERLSESATNVVEGIDKNIAMDTSEAEDINPLENTVHSNESMEFDITEIQNEDTFSLGFLFSSSSATSNTVTPSTRLNPCAMDPILEPSSTSFTLIRMPDDAVIPTHNRDPWDVCGTSQSSTYLSCNYPIPDNLSLQSLGSSRFWDLVMNGDTGRQIPRNITRTQIAVQALPDQSLLMHSRERAQPSIADSGGATETLQQRFSSSNMDVNSASDMSPTPPGFPPMTQNWVPRSHFPSQPPVQQTVGLPAPSRFLGSYQNDVRISSSQTSEDLHNLQPSPGTRVSQMASPPIMARAPPHLSRMQGRKGRSPSDVASLPKGKHSVMMSQQPAQSERILPLVPFQLQPRRGSSSLMAGGGHKSLIGEQREGNVEAENPDFTSVSKSSKVTPDQNWRPSGRMRGSLSGRSYSGALSQYIIRPTQVTSSSTIKDPPVNPSSTFSGSTGVAKIPSHIGNNSDTHAPTSANQLMHVYPEVCVELEVGSSKSEQ